MAKSDRNLAQIDVSKAYSNQFSATWVDGKIINSFDTETHKGTVFMLTYAHGDTVEAEYNNDVTELDDKVLMDKLTHHLTRSNINIWYNLDFDANAILSGILTQKQMMQLVVTNETTTVVGDKEYEITYIKDKFLEIRDSNDNISRHYDISQFFYMSLDKAADKWLGKNKVEGIDTSKFDDKDYIKDNFGDILHYAKIDAKLTQELGITLTEDAEDLDIPMGSPISTGYLSAEYLRANTEFKPGLGNEKMQGMFWESYYGGRFEVFKRGNVGKVAAPDINSAYPAIMKDLPNPKTLDWVHYHNDDEEPDMAYSFSRNKFTFEDIQKGHYGVVKAKVTTNPNRKIQPFACKIDGKVKYPVMTDKVITVIMPIFQFAVEEGLVTDYELIEAWIGNITDETTKSFKFIGDMYAQRKVYEILENRQKKGKLLKIVLNSSYGKTCQTTDSKRIESLDEGEIYETKRNESQYNRLYLSKKQREMLGDTELIITSSSAGNRFNPFFASYITGLTRLELHKQVVEHDLEENTVMFATDCLMIEKEAYENSDFDQQILTPDSSLSGDKFLQQAIESLGKWDYDYKGEAFVVGSGVYEVEKPDGKTKLKTRGFIEKNLNGSLKELAQKNPEGIPHDNERPLTMAEVLTSTKEGSVSQFIKESKKLTPDFDDKRIWDREEATFHDLLEEAEDSQPINLEKIKESKIGEAVERNSGELAEFDSEQITNEKIGKA